MCCLLLGTSQDSGLQLQKAPSKIRCWCISVVRSAAKAHQCWLFILNSSNNSVTVSLHTPGFFSEKSALPHLSRLEVLCQAVLLCPVKSSPSNKHSYCQEATLPSGPPGSPAVLQPTEHERLLKLAVDVRLSLAVEPAPQSCSHSTFLLLQPSVPHAYDAKMNPRTFGSESPIYFSALQYACWILTLENISNRAVHPLWSWRKIKIREIWVI